MFFIFLTAAGFAQPGLYAGAAKKFIGASFTGNHPDALLQPYRNTGGCLLDNSRLEFEVWMSQYQKGNTHLIVMHTLDTAGGKNTVLDVLELKLPDAATVIQTASCSLSGVYSVEIIATERKGKILNAWRASRDKLRFRKMDKAGAARVNCAVEGAG